MKVDGCGLDVVMAQAVSDICEGVAVLEHVDSPRVAEAVNGIDRSEAFWRQCHGEVLFTDPIETVASELFSALIDKETVLIGRFGGFAVFADIECEELGGFGLKLDKPEAIAFTQDGQRALLGIEVIQVEGCDFTGPGP